MGDRSIEVTEDMRDKAQEERQQGSMAMAEGQCTNVLQPLTCTYIYIYSNYWLARHMTRTCNVDDFTCSYTCVGDLDKALEHFTAAVLSNPNSAPLYAKRAR